MEEDHKTFEAYFKGNMRSAQANDFETALENNSNLKDKYDLFLATKKASSSIFRDEWRAELDDVNLDKSPSKIISIAKWVGGIAALLLLSFATFTFLKPSQPKDLFAQNFETYQVQKSRDGEDDPLEQLYSNGDYPIFIEKAEEAKATNELNMMLANAYLFEGKFTEAIVALHKISDDSALRDQKYWYLGLSYLKIGNREDAIDNFKKLKSSSNFKKEETEEILSNIDK